MPLFADPTYTVFQVPGAVSTSPRSINLFGTVTGSYTDANNTTQAHGFVRDASGQIATFDVPGCTETHPYSGTTPLDINIAGTVVGVCLEYPIDRLVEHSFMRDSEGTITSFDPPQCANGSRAQSINAEGSIVGTCYSFNSPILGYIRYRNGTFSTFNVTGASTFVTAINVGYLVTGTYLTGNGSNQGHGFVGFPSNQLPLATFDPPGSTSTDPMSINSVGAIAGSYRDSANVYHGFVRDPLGKFVAFNPMGSQNYSVNAINDGGAIVGSYQDSNGVWHGFVRAPHGTITAIDVPGSTSRWAENINDVGVIVGTFSTDGGKTYSGFVRTP
jgi:uncharacterized membrane protein